MSPPYTPALLDRIHRLAVHFHNAKGQKYGDEPYEVHLNEGRAALREFGFTEETHPHLHAAFSMHDVFEDTDGTPRDFEEIGTPALPISIARAVSDQPGKNRTERKAKTYPIIAGIAGATLIKLDDRIVNVRRAGKMDMYRKEQPSFALALRRSDPELEPMWRHLDDLFAAAV
jgi:(p)ppGpp synthase/HD superfamily hydrolase